MPNISNEELQGCVKKFFLIKLMSFRVNIETEEKTWIGVPFTLLITIKFHLGDEKKFTLIR